MTHRRDHLLNNLVEQLHLNNHFRQQLKVLELHLNNQLSNHNMQHLKVYLIEKNIKILFIRLE